MDVTSAGAVEIPADGSRKRAKMLPQDARALQGVWILLAALSVFFLSSILLFVFYISARVNIAGADIQRFYLPGSFIASTVLLVGVSVFLEMALRAAKRDRTAAVQRYAVIACVLGVAFLFVQTDGIYLLLAGVRDSLSVNGSAYAYTFILVLLHALHVVGGMVGLWWTTRNAMTGRYDHERSFGIQFCALYWHFLDVVWVILMICFWVAVTWVNSRV